ncbi:Rpn family recombination-promoting nuclease/putative transposase [Caldicellulosiruptor morganii]|uniref:Rpn family recombination-promoting nuclease/putative transposase n=1 Tax=Caldicellulosiruptor morganii TaxID=1387555 RepID=A0ABY7BNK8_9FIRM|nr:Rpn family recombination-promoting nuclease/putative transposase [Caldicellulosiruptor morganii]WAM33907.1 Rpn family recombination-promoting nuclease/putative transposase [Caldicellulosiruptor morganii]
MQNSLPPHEHDSTFKFLFENPRDILFLIKDVIGYSWAKDIQEDSIELADKELVGEDFLQRRADVVAKAKLKDREVYFYIIIENQSTVAKDMPERLLRYMILLWAKKIREGAEKLPAIIPIVTYNGLEKEWDVEQEIISEFDVFKNDIFRYALVNISKLDAKAFLCEEDDVLSPVVFYLEQVRDDTQELARRLKEVEAQLRKFSSSNIERFLIWAGNVIRPRLTKEDKEEFDRLVERVKQGGAGKMGEFVSNISRLLDEVQMKKFNEGKLEGKIEGKEEVAKKLIKKGFSDEDIAELTELDIERIRKLRKELIN